MPQYGDGTRKVHRQCGQFELVLLLRQTKSHIRVRRRLAAGRQCKCTAIKAKKLQQAHNEPYNNPACKQNVEHVSLPVYVRGGGLRRGQHRNLIAKQRLCLRMQTASQIFKRRTNEQTF